MRDIGMAVGLLREVLATPPPIIEDLSPSYGRGKKTLYTAWKGVDPTTAFYDNSPPKSRQSVRAFLRQHAKDAARKQYGSTKFWWASLRAMQEPRALAA